MEMPLEQIVLTSASLIISLVALLTARKSMRESINFNSRTRREKILSLPVVEVVQANRIGEKWRLKLLLFNLRKEPLRIECLKVYKYRPIERTLVNRIKRFFEGFDWDYEEIKGVFWNPQGIHNEEERFFHEAIQFTYVEKMETIWATVPSFDPEETYGFKVITTHGTCFKRDTVPGDRCHFPHDFERVLY